MSSRKTDIKPSFQVVDGPKARALIEAEIKKMKPKVDVSIEGVEEVFEGKIIEWDKFKKLITIRWGKKVSDSFQKRTISETGLRIYFKVHLFSTQLVFRTTTVRRLSEGEYQYRVPETIFKQQKRAALRVPVPLGHGILSCAEGKFPILDLSVGGAKVRISNKVLARFSHLTDVTLMIGKERITSENFSCNLTSQAAESRGYRFSGLGEAGQILLKQVLVELLRDYFKEELPDDSK